MEKTILTLGSVLVFCIAQAQINNNQGTTQAGATGGGAVQRTDAKLVAPEANRAATPSANTGGRSNTAPSEPNFATPMPDGRNSGTTQNNNTEATTGTGSNNGNRSTTNTSSPSN